MIWSRQAHPDRPGLLGVGEGVERLEIQRQPGESGRGLGDGSADRREVEVGHVAQESERQVKLVGRDPPSTREVGSQQALQPPQARSLDIGNRQGHERPS